METAPAGTPFGDEAVGRKDDDLALGHGVGEPGQRPLEAVGIEVPEGIVQQHGQRLSTLAHEPHRLEPLHQIRLLLRAGRERAKVDDGAGLGGLEADVQPLVDQGVRVAAARQP